MLLNPYLSITLRTSLNYPTTYDDSVNFYYYCLNSTALTCVSVESIECNNQLRNLRHTMKRAKAKGLLWLRKEKRCSTPVVKNQMTHK